MELQVIPFASLTEEFKVIRTREVLLFGASADTGVSSAGVAVKTEQMWQALEWAHILSCSPKALVEGRNIWHHWGLEHSSWCNLYRESTGQTPDLPDTDLNLWTSWRPVQALQACWPLNSQSPSEDHFEDTHELKVAKYQQLVEFWRVEDLLWTLEMGYRRFLGRSPYHTLTVVGIRGLQEWKASRWLWIKKREPWCSALLGHKPGPDHLQLSHPGERTPGLFIGNVTQLLTCAGAVSLNLVV